MSRLTNALLITMCLLLCLNVWLQLQQPVMAQRAGDVTKIQLVDAQGNDLIKSGRLQVSVSVERPLSVELARLRDPVPINLKEVGGSSVWGGNGIPISLEDVDSSITFRMSQR